MSLHDRIMAILDGPYSGGDSWNDGYVAAVEEAADIAKEADELMAEMAAAISVMTRWISEGGSNGDNESINDICKMGEDSSAKYSAYKESTK